MKRFHVHLNVTDLAASVRFYSNLFAAEPTVAHGDYAKWMLDDPRVNFAISTRDRTPGVDHLGIQADSESELAEIGERLDRAGASTLAEIATTCCYARSDKVWTEDPQGTRWESFHTFGDATSYHGADAACASDSAACAPLVAAATPAPTPRSPSAAVVACCRAPAACG